MKALNFKQRGLAICLLRSYKDLGSLADLSLDLHYILKLISSSEPYVFEDGYQIRIEDVIANTKKSFEKFYNVRNVSYCEGTDADELDRLSMHVVLCAKSGETFDEFYDAWIAKLLL